MLTIFSTCKPFVGHTAVIQGNAIESWTLLEPKPEIILFGDEPGVAEIAGRLGCRHYPTIGRNEQGTPMLGTLFRDAQVHASYDLLCYINADLIVNGLIEAVSVVAEELGLFLMVGPRWNVPVEAPMDFSEGWWDRLMANVYARGEQCQPTGLDYFAFRRGVYDFSFPALVVGRYSWDNWLVWRAAKAGIKVVDATAVVTAVHQHHARLPIGDLEAKINMGIASERGRSGYVWEADYYLASDGLHQRHDRLLNTWRSLHNWTGNWTG